MKISVTTEFNIPAFTIDPEADKFSFPGMLIKTDANADCTEEEYKLVVNTTHEIAKAWLPIKQDIVKAIFCNVSFRELFSVLWANATDAVIKMNPFKAQPEVAE